MAEHSTRRLLTVTEFAAQLHISRSKLYEELALGRIKSVHIGRARRFPIEELEYYVQRLRAETDRQSDWTDQPTDSSPPGDER